MYMIRTSIASALVVLAALSAQAQSSQELQLLRQNPGLAQQFMGNGGVLQQDAQTQNIPTAPKPRTLNAEDALENQNVLLQSQAGPTIEESVIQRYYRILTGELLDVYGAQEFGQQQDNQLLFFNTMGKDYRLAAGDVLRVTLRGLTESDQTYTIGRDGNLILPSLAPIAVSGLSIAEAEEKLLNILRYDDAAASVYMSLDTARLVTVQVSGAVKNPRTLAVPAYTPLSRVLAYSGGIKPTGSLRNIVLRDRDGSVSKIDFYDFLQSPIGANDPVVTDASRIFVGNQNNTVAAMGFVARPGIYELDEEVTEISVRTLLELSGTRILAPGTTLEALYVDAEGYTQRRALTQSGIIKAGEVLNLRFLATRLTEAVNVKGAVLEEYQIATNQPLMISDLLKDGATLKPEAFRDIAVIVSENARARTLDLERSFSDRDAMIHPGETLHILTSAQLRELAGADINSERSVLLDALLEADVAELYLNGKRIAYLPTSDDERFSDALRPFYRVTPDTTLELAVIDNTNGDAEAVSLRELLVSNNPYPIEPGDRIYLFEDKFLQLNTDDIAEAGSLISAPEKTTWRDLSKLFGRANVTRITLNHEVRAFLPQQQADTLQNVLDILGIQSFDNIADFAVVSRARSLQETEVELLSSFDQTISLRSNVDNIDLFTDEYFQDVLADASNKDFQKIKGAGISLFVDYELSTMGPIDNIQKKTTALGQLLSDPKIYPIFSIYEYFDEDAGFWEREALSLSDLRSDGFTKKAKPGSRLTVFTKDFIRETLDTGSGSGSDANAQLVGLQASGIGVDGVENPLFADQDNDLIPSAEDDRVLSPNLQFILSSSRFVSGAVEKPGYYPVAGRTSLAQVIAAAGGLTENADLQKVEVIRQKISSGKIVADRIDRIDLTRKDASEIKLSDRYSINVPAYINDVASGIIILEGEVSRPGEYLFSRALTLHEIIKEAGGFTEVAYPLGAVFTRDSLRDSQKQSNAVLADQLEQAILQLSQSEREGAADQIQAVVGYAQQLRNQDVSGRLSVNVSLPDPTSPIYLENGDRLIIPKRPSHVSVIGSVQKDTVVSYSAQKSFNDYVFSAGGANKIADVKRAYILLPNGESTSAHENAIIPPGSVIVIPPKTDRLTVLGLTDIVSRVLGNIATSVLAINNVQ